MEMGDNGGSGLAPAGWYPDPTNPDHERLWTGERWIAWIRPIKIDRIEANPAGWRDEPGREGFERLWSGEMWTEEIRRAGEVAGALPGVTAPTAALRPPPSLAPRRGAIYLDDSPPEKLGTLGRWVGVALAVTIASRVAEMIANQIYIGVLRDVLDGRLPNFSHVESVVTAVHTLRIVNLGVVVVTAILFLVWFYRAYRNLVRVGVSDLRFGPGWAVGGWFIPFFNFVRPKQIANDIWKASASAGTVGIERRYELSLPALINWWWGLWILGGVLGLSGRSGASDADGIYSRTDLHSELTGMWFGQVGIGFSIVAAVLAILVVRQISRLQDANFEAPETTGLPVTADVGSAAGAAATAVSTKTCPDCAEDVKAAARVCRFCGYRFDQGG